VDRLLETKPFPEDSAEQRLLRAMQRSHFTLFETIETMPGLGVRGLDGSEQTPIVIVDVGFSQTAVPGAVLATRIYSPEEGWWMTSGTALPLNHEAVHQMARGFQNYAQRHGREPSESQREAIVRRACIQSGSSRQVSYANIGSGSDQRPAPAIRSAPKIGRNDPCPCGSGKKYKKCCGGAP
ncbi:MAG TPA: SEC-C metal-binding domain-containing protein, partial [Tepidisphaeraceae bacterium]|nr:SEC-C metal-binding domain-containing protein [Tepidisphaeraceae bacterium]